MKTQNGFTLIELVIVIIVLGILAATAVPKFINLQDDAKVSAMKGVEAAVHSAANIVYSKSAIDGTETSTTAGASAAGVTIINGYPTADAAGIVAAVELSGFEGKADNNNNLIFVSKKEQANADLCLLYKASTGTGYDLDKGKMLNSACNVSAPNNEW
ncbi:MSHA pilin protein MshA [Moritella viscosa]|uniref:type II secretion system protein n=1 Tax=Moritella viscosa TaxID=80854 RepID=UPI000508F1BB|nr:type II secretion system protein [Moritella viscosa]CED62117.1 type IV pilus, mannose-sensitive hemagglutinin A [Moritella viscosa]SHO07279.1 MSHA pilin protein MshA [Moritella viscosa]SHO07372.1 MSHA pilin protein MshA [Moritella viscosa]SHO08312.1 MSHA pilin protein MshA [Moritella viscosa]SHO11251.1 MSHA pilin protein MshA [Moritella viscosa]